MALINIDTRLGSILNIGSDQFATHKSPKVDQVFTKVSYVTILASLKRVANNSIGKKSSCLKKLKKQNLSQYLPGTLILEVKNHINTQLINKINNTQLMYPEILKKYVNENVALNEVEQISQAIKQIQLDKGTSVALDTLNKYEAWAEEKTP